LGSFEDALGIVGEDHAEAGIAAGRRHHEAGTGKGLLDGAIEISRILADMDQRGEDRRQVRSVGGEAPAGPRQERTAKRRAGISAHLVISASISFAIVRMSTRKSQK